MILTDVVTVALCERDRLTHDHCDRVAGLSLELGRQCGFSSGELEVLRVAARLHDVGKIGIPDAVLQKVTPLTDEDWTVMKAHAEKSQRIILAAGLENGDAIARIARHHHERYDGLGYPDGLAGEDIPIMARIIALADTYDAMARTRVYRLARPHDRIMHALAEAQGRQHDPYLWSKFAKLLEHSEFRSREESISGDDDDDRCAWSVAGH